MSLPLSGPENPPTKAPGDFLAGVIEGFYGRQWSGDDRRAYARLLPGLGLNSYLYCPKGDPFLRRRWQEHWPAAEWSELCALARCFGDAGLHFGVGLSPFALYRSYGAGERRQLRDKLARLADIGGDLLALLFDDMPGDVPDLAERQAEIVADVGHWYPGARLLMCPTYYSSDPVLERVFGARPPQYWEQLGDLLPPEVEVFWTGERVCSEQISASDLEGPARLLGRRLTLWDNYPVNDGAQRSRHLYLHPLAGREEDIRPWLAGHFCNPMNQAWLSLPALRGLAELHGGAPPADWEAGTLGDALWRRLRRDRDQFLDQGLDRLGEERRAALASEYAALPGPGAAEAAGWLRGEYVFDPDCLTD